jgi:septal ring factor EnvC (AmiA/AmiB activator)
MLSEPIYYAMLMFCRPFLEQNEKLQATETELEEFQRRLREKDLELAELRNELNKSKLTWYTFDIWLTMFKNPTWMKLSRAKVSKLSTTVC